METELITPDTEVIRQYEEGGSIYLIYQGEVGVIVSEDS